MKKLKAFRNTVHWIIIFGLMSLFLVPFTIFATDGKLITESVHCPALEGNLLGDAPDRSVIIYLPPGYEDNPDKRYPVIYLLHGYYDDPLIWTKTRNISNICNTLIEHEAIQSMIIVMPNAKNKYLGSWYTNSSVAGNWEDFITQNLVAYVDSTYQTIPQSASRGIAGHSMGGYGAMKLAMKHPDIYGAVYSLSGVLVFDNFYLDRSRKNIVLAVKAESLPEDGSLNFAISSAVVFTPNPDTQPFQCDFPLDENGQLIESVWQKWLQHDPLTMITSFRENLLLLRGLRLDCGTSDGWCITGNRIFSQALKDANIPHVFEEYEGNHTSEIPNRIEKYLLPFFSEVLAFQVE
ncbi:alpha/beta hydrolase [Candidatus Latescibacterota bacterium]